MTSPNLWNQLLVWPIVNLLVVFYKLFEWLHLPGPLGWAIILLTIAIRLLLYPLMQQQLKSAKKMAELKPHLDALSAKHKDDKGKLQQAQLELYKQHGVNPAAGCLPLLIQFPVLIALYNVFYQVLNNGNLEKMIGEINSILYWSSLKLSSLDLTFFGINLGVKPGEWQKYGWWLLTVPLITALLQWYQTKLMTPSLASSKFKIQNSKLENQKENKEKIPEDTAAEMQKQMALITPIMFGFFALQFPLGLSLYWNVFGIVGILQQLRINTQKS
ncbi:MAG: YidC/Oxa1 family membrane protein insertase [Patescibacteria group bacterium]